MNEEAPETPLSPASEAYESAVKSYQNALETCRQTNKTWMAVAAIIAIAALFDLGRRR